MNLLLYGASGHGKVVADIISNCNDWKIIGFIDDDSSRVGQINGKIPVIGTSSSLPDLVKSGIKNAIITIGHNQMRSKKGKELERLGFRLISAIHSKAVVASDCLIGAGTVVMAGAIINSGSSIGQNAIINTGATVDHDCVLEDGVHISPGAHLAGNVRVGRNAHIGIGASVIQDISIGEESVVGAGAVVISDVNPGTTVIGMAARPIVRR